MRTHFGLLIYTTIYNFICSEMTVNVTVVDINDNAPRFDSSTYTREISENAIASTIITFVARDEDSTSNGMITYVPSNLSSEYIIIELTL